MNDLDMMEFLIGAGYSAPIAKKMVEKRAEFRAADKTRDDAFRKAKEEHKTAYEKLACVCSITTRKSLFDSMMRCIICGVSHEPKEVRQY